MKTQKLTLIKKEGILFNVLGIFLFTLLMGCSAFIKIPLFFTPVPITLQTFVLFVSIVFLKQRAIYSQFLYILLGVSGIPIFSSGGYLFSLTSPSGGYIFGFCLMALIVPYLLASLSTQKQAFLKIALLFAAANVVFIYGCGIAWLHYAYSFSWYQGVMSGMVPFIIGDIVKILAVSALAVKMRTR